MVKDSQNNLRYYKMHFLSKYMKLIHNIPNSLCSKSSNGNLSFFKRENFVFDILIY